VILDTNALSAFAEGSTLVAAALRSSVQPAVPVVVLGEYLYGIAHSTRRRIYETWLNRYLPTFRVLEITMGTAAEYAAIRSELKQAGRPIPANDVWIAALCRQHELPLLSRNGHFDYVRHLRRTEW
jgi:tRNA(fMet)-specific endonuclease VapC